MTSFFAKLFLAIQNQIITTVPDIKWIDLDIGQLEHYQGERAAVSFPCILIDFLNSSYTEEGALAQWGQCTIQLRLGFSPYANANSAAPDISKQNALYHYEIEQKIFASLHGWSPMLGVEIISQPLIRQAVASEERNDAYRVRIITFTTAFEDADAMQQMQLIKPNLAVIPT